MTPSSLLLNSGVTSTGADVATLLYVSLDEIGLMISDQGVRAGARVHVKIGSKFKYVF
jgi:hypothetical protein